MHCAEAHHASALRLAELILQDGNSDAQPPFRHPARDDFVVAVLHERGSAYGHHASSNVSRVVGLGALVGGVAASARAQQGSIAGQVTDQATGHPLAGARVTIHGTSLVTSSNAEGRYTLRNVLSGAVTVPATIIGYAAATRALTVGPGEAATADLALKLTPYTLDAVVSTVSGDQTRKETPNAISTIGADKLVQT